MKPGPNTPAGKKIVAQNAFKHGMTAQTLKLSKEDAKDFDELRAQVLADLTPDGTLQTIVAEDIVCSYWRYQRALQWETALFTKVSGENGNDVVEKLARVPSRRDLPLVLENLKEAANAVNAGDEISGPVMMTLGRFCGEGTIERIREWPASKWDDLYAFAIYNNMKVKGEMYDSGPDKASVALKELAEDTSRGIKNAIELATAQLKTDMQTKLLAIERASLLRLCEVVDAFALRTELGTGSGIDGATRYISSLRKALYTAMAAYRDLRRQ